MNDSFRLPGFRSWRLLLALVVAPAGADDGFVDASHPDLSVAQSTPALAPVPHPDLSVMEPPVRAVLERAIADAESVGDETRAEAYGTLGMLYHAHQLFDAAVVAYRNALAFTPDDKRWLYYLAFLEQQTGVLDFAIVHYRRAAELMPDYLPAKIRLGQSLLERGDADAAREQFQSVVAQAPANAAALAGLGKVAIQKRDFQAAVDYLEAALAQDGGATRLHYPLALAYRQIGDVDRARAHVSLRGREGPALEDPLLESMARLSQSSHYYITQGFTASYEGRYQDAEELFREAVQVNPDDPTAHAALGRILELAHHFEAALDEFEAALRLAPHDVMASYFKGALLEHFERDAEARALYRVALDQEPERAEVRLLLGKSLLRDGAYAQAAAQFEILADNDSADVTAAYYLGLARLAGGDCQAAVAALARAVELGPLYHPALKAYARAGASCPGADVKLRVRALTVAEAMTQSGGDAPARETLAMALAANGRFEEATELQSVLVKTATEDAFLRENLKRYRAHEPADRAWPEGHSVFAPKRVSTYNR